MSCVQRLREESDKEEGIQKPWEDADGVGSVTAVGNYHQFNVGKKCQICIGERKMKLK